MKEKKVTGLEPKVEDIRNARGPLLRHVKPFRKLVYNLLYPGVLGSMLFDLFDPVRLPSLTQVSLVLIAVLFMLDYLHMQFNLGADKSRNSRPLIDALIAIAYCFGYFTLSATTDEQFKSEHIGIYEAVSISFVFLALILALYYQIWASAKKSDKGGLYIAPGIAFVGALFLFIAPVSPDVLWLGVRVHTLLMIFVTLLTTIGYGIYVLIGARPNSLSEDKPIVIDIAVAVLFVVLSGLWIKFAPRRESVTSSQPTSARVAFTGEQHARSTAD